VEGTSTLAAGNYFPFDQVCVPGKNRQGLLWNAPLLWLYQGIQAKSAKNEIKLPDDLKFYKLLWPELPAYLFIMLPAVIELVANAPKIHEMINAGPPLRRV